MCIVSPASEHNPNGKTEVEGKPLFKIKVKLKTQLQYSQTFMDSFRIIE